MFPILSKFARFSLIVILLVGCAPGVTPATVTVTPSSPIQEAQTIVEPHNELLAQVTFEVDAPAKTPSGQTLYIDLLDEVTGLALNPTRYRMESKGSNHFTLQIPIPIGSMVKYRYGREGATPMLEYSSSGNQVRYRLLQVQAPVTVKDIIGGWKDLPFDGKFGRITGQITDVRTNAPLPNIMVSAGGVQTFTASDGTYIIEGLPAGIHNLVAYSLDGSYQPYQQGAQVSADMATPAPIHLDPAALVKVTFVTHAPSNGVSGIPIRILGNVLSLGNTFADLGGGVSTLASRAPLMVLQPDGSYSLTLTLPAGLDLRYKYSSGDGFWNAEHNSDGSFQVRQFIIPTTNVTVEDTIKTWQAKDTGSVTFTVTVPDTTPASDTVSIQFNPYGWTEPIPMWPLGNHQWLFVLYSPLQLVTNIGYRYCRNDQCSVADDAASMGPNSTGKLIASTKTAQNVQDVVKNWAFLDSGSTPTTVVAQDIQPRGANFMAGIEFSPKFRPSWQPYISTGLDNVKQIGANWVIFDPTWTATRATPPVFEPVTGKDAYWQDLIQMMVWAQDKDLKIALYPNLNFDPSFEKWWNSTKPDENWWQVWFDRYSSYIMDHATLAAQINAGVLILGDPGVSPSLPGGKLPNGNSANPPADADKRWRSLIANVRTQYKGKIAWALPYAGSLTDVPSFLSDVDEIYVLWSVPVMAANGATTNTIAADMGKLLDKDIQSLKKTLNKPIILGVNYPSITGVLRGCALVVSTCVPFDSLDVETAQTQIIPNLSEQATLYNAILVALNQRTWLDGIVSRGFYPPATLQDFTPSVHGKPASDILWYRYPRLLVSPN
jgi:hypothetical protein